jgi:hypothetical protein
LSYFKVFSGVFNIFHNYAYLDEFLDFNTLENINTDIELKPNAATNDQQSTVRINH